MTTLLEKINRESKKVRITDMFFPVSNTYDLSTREKIVFINTGDIYEGKFLHKNLTDVKKLPGQAKKIIKQGDILFSEIRPKNRHFAKVDFDAIDYVVSTKLIVLRVKDGVDPNFAYTVLTSDKSLKEFQNIAEARSGTFPQITFESIANFEVDLPDFQTQKRIADVINSFDEKFENNRIIIQKIESLAQVLVKQWFIKLNFPGNEKTKSGDIPNGWASYELRELFSFVKGKKPAEVSVQKEDGLLPQILIETLDGGSSFYTDPEGMVVSTESDLLMVMDGASSGRVEFGMSGVVGSTLSKLVMKKDIKSILYFFLKLNEKDIRSGSTGSAIPHTDKEKIHNYTINLPEDPIKFEEHFLTFIQEIRQLKIENRNLKSLREQLVKKLI